ncbi:MAG: DNA methylase, partial [Chloroflexi bacterium]|nr:DNA methylase [Chloroflexota bacterium]
FSLKEVQCSVKVLKSLSWASRVGWVVEDFNFTRKALFLLTNFGEGIVWSDVFICPQCGTEMTFWDVAVDQQENDDIRGLWKCPKCSSLLSKSPSKSSGALRIERAHETSYDHVLGKMVRRTKQVPAQINYGIGQSRLEKRPDSDDLLLIERIEKFDDKNSFSSFPMMFIGERWGDTWRAGVHEGISHSHHFYTKRNSILLGALWNRIISITDNRIRTSILFLSQSLTLGFTRLNRYGATHYSQVNRFLSGTLYVSSLMSEVSLHYAFNGKLNRLIKAFSNVKTNQKSSAISTSSSTKTTLAANTIDYIFVDPPFGGNLMYSELNFLWEAWQKVFTNNQSEAIVNENQNKGQVEYQGLMQACFDEFHRVLKPGRWMTIEFHNSQNSIWNAIQESLQRAGFVIADVRVLDKQQETFKQATTTAAVKQDLIISAYKPNGSLEENFRLKAGSVEGVWEFVRYHLGKLPVVNQADGNAIVNAERQAFLLFDRMVAFHIQRGVMVPISSPEFYAGLTQRFTPRDGMYFLPEQVTEYDRALLASGKPTQMQLSVSDEKTAITWLRQQLDPTTDGEPQTRGDLTNKFNATLHRAKHEKALELIEILDQNFLQDENGKWFVPDHNKATDLDRVRQRALLKEYNEYVTSTGRLRLFRTEAVRAGFADCFKRQDYDALIKVAERLPEDVLREDPDLLMYYDSALLRKK